MAGALGAAGRQLWRRKDLEPSDEVVIDLLAEALVRLGQVIRPKGAGAAALAAAPQQLRKEVELFVALASRGPPPVLTCSPVRARVAGSGGLEGGSEAAAASRAGAAVESGVGTEEQKAQALEVVAAPVDGWVAGCAGAAAESGGGAGGHVRPAVTSELQLCGEAGGGYLMGDEQLEAQAAQSWAGGESASGSSESSEEIEAQAAPGGRPQWHLDLLESFGVRLENGVEEFRSPHESFVYDKKAGWRPEQPLSDLWRARL